MEPETQPSGKHRRGTFSRTPPTVFSTRSSLRKPQSSTSLQRAPSAPYPRSQVASQPARDIHQRTKSSAYGSSTSSLDHQSSGPSPVIHSTDFFPAFSAGHQAQAQAQSQYPLNAQSINDRPNDLIGAPFDANGLLSSLNATQDNGLSSLQRPQPPHTHTSPDLRFQRQSRTYPTITQGGMEVTPPRSDNGTMSPKRFSGEVNSGKPPGPLRKKSGFSSFVNSMLGSPKTIKISYPENPVHMIHVGFDNITGQYTVSPPPQASCRVSALPYHWYAIRG